MLLVLFLLIPIMAILVIILRPNDNVSTTNTNYSRIVALGISIINFFFSITALLLVITIVMKFYVTFVVNQFADIKLYWLLYGIVVYSLAILIFATLKLKKEETVTRRNLVHHAFKLIIVSISIHCFLFFYSGELSEILENMEGLIIFLSTWVISLNLQIPGGNTGDMPGPITHHPANRSTETTSGYGPSSASGSRRGNWSSVDSSSINRQEKEHVAQQFENTYDYPKEDLIDFSTKSNLYIENYLSDRKEREETLRKEMKDLRGELIQKNESLLRLVRDMKLSTAERHEMHRNAREAAENVKNVPFEAELLQRDANVPNNKSLVSLRETIKDVHHRSMATTWFCKEHPERVTPDIAQRLNTVTEAVTGDIGDGTSLLHNFHTNHYNMNRAIKAQNSKLNTE